MRRRALIPMLLGVATFGCDQPDPTPVPPSPSTPTPPAATEPVAQADGLDARATKLVKLKLPGMV